MDSPTASVFGTASLPELRDAFPGCCSHEELYKFSIQEVSQELPFSRDDQVLFVVSFSVALSDQLDQHWQP